MGKFEKPRTPNGQPAKKPVKVTKAAHASKPTAAQKHAGKSGGSGKKVALIIAAVVLVLVIGVVGYAAVLHTSGNIFPGVYVAGVDVGGMSREEAAAAISEAVEKTYGSSTLSVKLPDRVLSFEPEDTKGSMDAEAAAQAAWEYGRDGGVFQTLKATLFPSNDATHLINLADSLTLDEEYVRSVIDQAAADAASEKKDSTYEVVTSEVEVPAEDGGEDAEPVKEAVPTELVITVGTSKRSLDAEDLYNTVIAAYMNNDFTTIEYSYEEEAYTPVDLDALYKEMCTDMADAYYDSEKKEIVDEVVGYGFDLAAAKQQQAMAEEGSTLTITLSEVEPEVTRADLE